MMPDQMTVRESKDKLGMLAYLKSIVGVIKDPVQSVYSLTIDGQEFEGEGMICAVVNSLGLGFDIKIDEPVRLDDGLLDIFLINKDVGAAVKSLVNREEAAKFFQHWQGRDITIRCEMEQDIWVDGEPTDKTPFSAKAAPNALRVVVPIAADDEQGEEESKS
jgi:diacylglycerol kinase family enzyme